MKNEFTLEKAKVLIDYALREFYKKDKLLVDYKSIKESVSENCIVFRIGWYMLDKIQSDPLYSGISLDCQYNRNFEHPKRLFRETEENIITKTKNAIPDLLLHKRRSNSENLMVLEFKKGRPQEVDMENDVEKLSYFTSLENEYKYKFGFHIWLYKNQKAKIKVYQDGKEKASLNYDWSINE